MLLIYTTACALIINDAETLCNVARFFMKKFQFVTDSYRLYTSLNRLCNGPRLCFNAAPSQKYLLRQIKAMDHSLIQEGQRKTLFQERASYTMKDDDGNPIKAEELDIGLLILYGHVLYAGTSYAFALSKPSLQRGILPVKVFYQLQLTGKHRLLLPCVCVGSYKPNDQVILGPSIFALRTQEAI